MSGPEVAKTPGGGAPGKEGKEPVANGHTGESSDANPFAEYMWMENEEEYNRQVSTYTHTSRILSFGPADFSGGNNVKVLFWPFSFVCKIFCRIKIKKLKSDIYFN